MQQFYYHEILIYRLNLLSKQSLSPTTYIVTTIHSSLAVSPDLISLLQSVMYMGWCAYSFIIILIGWSKVETGKRLSVVNWCDVFTPTFFLSYLKRNLVIDGSGHIKSKSWPFFIFTLLQVIDYLVLKCHLKHWHVCLLSENRKMGNKFQKPH